MKKRILALALCSVALVKTAHAADTHYVRSNFDYAKTLGKAIWNQTMVCRVTTGGPLASLTPITIRLVNYWPKSAVVLAITSEGSAKFGDEVKLTTSEGFVSFDGLSNGQVAHRLSIPLNYTYANGVTAHLSSGHYRQAVFCNTH
jgi:hypothetical protein